MKRLTVVACTLACLFACISAYATPADPSILMDDPTCTGQQSYTGGTLSFTAINGGGYFAFCNNLPEGQRITFVDIKFPNASSLIDAGITCSAANGFFCSEAIQNPDGTVEIQFTLTPPIEIAGFDSVIAGGYQTNAVLSFNLNDPCADGCLPTDNEFAKGGWFDNNRNNATAYWAGNQEAVVPEPSTLLLLGSGLVGLWKIRRHRA